MIRVSFVTIDCNTFTPDDQGIICLMTQWSFLYSVFYYQHYLSSTHCHFSTLTKHIYIYLYMCVYISTWHSVLHSWLITAFYITYYRKKDVPKSLLSKSWSVHCISWNFHLKKHHKTDKAIYVSELQLKQK